MDELLPPNMGAYPLLVFWSAQAAAAEKAAAEFEKAEAEFGMIRRRRRRPSRRSARTSQART